MGLLVSIIAMAIITLIGMFASAAPYFFGVVLPYMAVVIFIGGIIVRVLRWARAPVPFRITTTCGQQKSLDFIRQNKLDNPFTGFQTFLRMVLEVLFFRSLFRNTKADLRNNEKLTYIANKWLWLFSIVFHYSFLVVVLRHFRLISDPVPAFVHYIEVMDGFFQIGIPVMFITSIGILAGALFLFGRRLFSPQVRYFSLSSDYFPLLLILGIAVTGILMRHFDKVDLNVVKELMVGVLTFNPVVPQGLETLFFVHLFFVCVLLIYFPMSKLVHMAGVFMSPTRNMANNNRAKRHINPWNPDVEFHTYEEYEDEFRDFMKSVDLPLEKEGDDVK